jgi:hypothetical protein
LIKLIKELHPNEFRWAPYKTYVNPGGIHHLDKLSGMQDSEALFELPMHSFIHQCTKQTSVKEWASMVKTYLIY